MKNLKKVLAFVLVVAMMASLVISASALSAKDFTDYSEIVNKDAVAMLTELKVINGYPTGDYQPANVVTRAEMAKMIYTALMGGNDSAPVQKTNKYSDVWSGMWCEGYVAFCDELGIIAGYGDGTFGPNDPVTAVQAAKMLLVAMGYDAAKEGFVADPQWSYNILKVASAKGLFEGFTADTGAGCTRDNAALLIYNALKAENVTYVGTSAVNNGETLLGNVFGIEEVTGVVVANEYANLFGDEPLRAGYTEIALLGTHYIEQDQAIDPDYVVTNIKEAADYVITFVGELIGAGAGKKDPADTSNRTEIYDEKPGTSWLVEFNRREAVGAWDEYNTLIFKKTTELAQVGETVTVFAKVDANGEYTEAVVGNVLSDDDCVVSVYDGVDYEKVNENVDKNTRYFVNYAMAWDTKGAPSRYWEDADVDGYAIYNDKAAIYYNLPGETTKCVDVDGDGVVELVLKTRPVFAQAEYSKYFDSWYFDGYYHGDGQYKDDGIFESSIVSENGFEDGDFVLVTYVDGTYYVEKAASVQGYVDKVSYTEEDYPFVVLEDGTKLDESGLYWFNQGHNTNKDSKDYCDYTDHTHYGEGRDAVTMYSYIADCGFEDEYVFYLDAQGNVVGYTPVAGAPGAPAKVALMSGSYIDGSFLYGLTYANEEGVALYTVDSGKLGFVSGDDADFFVETGISAKDVNAGVLIGGTLFYKLNAYDNDVVNHMAYILANGGLNDGKYGYGKETTLVAITEKGEAVKAGTAKTDGGPNATHFVALTDTEVEADQYKFGSSEGNVYASKNTTFFIYEKTIGEIAGKYYYEVNVYSFTGYKNLPKYGEVYYGLEYPDEDGNTKYEFHTNGVTCGYALIDSNDEASVIVLEVATDGKDYVDDLAFVLEFTYARKNQITVKYLNAEGKLCEDTFCVEDSYTLIDKEAEYGVIALGNVYGIVECEDGYALIDAEDTLGYVSGSCDKGFNTGKVINRGEYFEVGDKQYIAEDAEYYGFINVTTTDKRQTKVIVVKFNNYDDFAMYTKDSAIGALWSVETNKTRAYNQVNALIANINVTEVEKAYLYGGVGEFLADERLVTVVASQVVEHPVVVEEAGVVEDPAAPAPEVDPKEIPDAE